MKTEELLSLGVPLLFLVMLCVETRHSARAYEPISRWRWIGTTFFVATLVIGSVTPLFMPSEFLKSHRVLDLSSLDWRGIPLGVLTTTFFGYWLHRAQHRFDWLWLATHQLHHSPVRVDMLGAFYTHPLGVAVKVAMGAVVGTWLLGLSPVASSAVGLVTAALSLFLHWNIRTPHALGYFIHRPESHCLHHERDVHSRNFSDLPLWDMVFGTFHNPVMFDGKVGFDGDRSSRLVDMLLMRDVHRQTRRPSIWIRRFCCPE